VKIQHYTQTPAETYSDVDGVSIRWVINKDDGAPTFAMRVIEVQPDANTPYHTHDWEHEVFVLEGQGTVRGPDGEETEVGPGSVVFIPPDEPHGFYNRGAGVLRFVCLIPFRD
jgi:quercetin dioxygenase-like cupin family protein